MGEMPALDENAQSLLAYLVTRLPEIIPENPETLVTYKQVHDALGLKQRGPSFGISLRTQGLVSLAEWTSATGKPAITSLIVDEKTRRPGPGFFELIGYDGHERDQRWAQEVEASRRHDWSKHVDWRVMSRLATESRSKATIWKLITHHEEPKQAFEEMVSRNAVAVGWTAIGDINALAANSATQLSFLIQQAYPDLKNAHLGGPSLWNLYSMMRQGDLVIASGGGLRMGVFEITGDYFFDETGVLGYCHQRAGTLTSIDADELWSAVGSKVAPGQNSRWTLSLCRPAESANRLAFYEGERFDIRSTAYERNPVARQECLRHHGRKCFVCGFDFETVYGELGAGYIHVHHRRDLSLSLGRYEVDPIRDLVPLCPNCHAMVHREKPAIQPEDLKRRLSAARSS